MRRIIQLFSQSNNTFFNVIGRPSLETKEVDNNYICNFADDYYDDQRCICVEN